MSSCGSPSRKSVEEVSGNDASDAGFEDAA
jgi:hypothetical protein